MVASYLERPIRMVADNDFFFPMKGGVICEANSETLRQDLLRSGTPVKRDETLNFGILNNLIVGFKLNRAFSKAELHNFRKRDEEQQKTIRNTIYATAPDVEIHKLLATSLREATNLERHTQTEMRNILGGSLVNDILQMYRTYYEIASYGRKDERRFEAMQKMNRHLGDAMSILICYSDLAAVSNQTIARTGLALSKLRELLNKKIGNFYHNGGLGHKIKEAHLEQQIDNTEVKNAVKTGEF